MTEELRQKAKDYANDKADKGNYDYAVGDNVYFCKSALEQAYIAGATENGIQWHDLRKDPNDLPTTPKDADEWRTVLGQDGNLWFYNENERSWYTIGDDNEWGTGTHVPIAWCEIPQFKE